MKRGGGEHQTQIPPPPSLGPSLGPRPKDARVSRYCSVAVMNPPAAVSVGSGAETTLKCIPIKQCRG